MSKRSKRPYIQFLVADFLSETTHLSPAEAGAYVFLRLHYWVRGCLPTDEAAIQRITRLTNRQWKKSRDVLKAFFGDDWKHQQWDADIAHMIERSEVNAANAMRSHPSRRPSANSLQGVRESNAASLANPPNTPNYSLSPQAITRVQENGCVISPDFQLSDEDRNSCRKDGANDETIGRELKRFVGFYLEKGTVSHDWKGSWLKWWANRRVPTVKPKALPSVVQTKQPESDDWHRTCEMFARNQSHWTRGMGPEPGAPGCKCPHEIMKQYGIDPETGIVRRISRMGRS